jgi:hypothetical protein
MIRCIALNTIDMGNLFLSLQKDIKKHFNNAEITLVSNKQYWKYPECNDIVYNLSNDEFIKVSDFIKLFLVSWACKERYLYSVDLNRQVWAEDAIWSKNCYPEERFLVPTIEWVDIYTWEEEDPTIN